MTKDDFKVGDPVKIWDEDDGYVKGVVTKIGKRKDYIEVQWSDLKEPTDHGPQEYDSIKKINTSK